MGNSLHSSRGDLGLFDLLVFLFPIFPYFSYGYGFWSSLLTSKSLGSMDIMDVHPKNTVLYRVLNGFDLWNRFLAPQVKGEEDHSAG